MVKAYSGLSRDHVFCSLEYSLLRGLSSSLEVLSGSGMGTQGSGRVTLPGGTSKMSRCGAQEHALMAELAVLG